MLKRIVVILILFLCVNEAHAQWFSIEGGYGANFGGLGGSINLGPVWTVGLGTFKGQSTYAVGVRYPLNWQEMKNENKWMDTPWIGFSIGTIGVHTETRYVYSNSFYNYREETSKIDGYNILGGYIIVLDKNGKIFMDTAAGYAFGKVTMFKGTNYELEYDFNAVTFHVGVGIQLF